MFVLAMTFLVLLAGLVHRGRELMIEDWSTWEAWLLLGGLALLWPIFWVEEGIHFFLYDRERRDRKALFRALVTALFPPARMATHSVARPNEMWLPWLGWQPVDFDLQKTLERAFGGPMFFMAMMILPILAVEYFWSDAVETRPALRLAMAVGIGLIWIAFTTEFIIRISAAEKKLGYAFRHWVDLAVVLLPMVEFMPFLRVLRVTRFMRLDTLVRLAKYYRMYGLAGKGWRGMIVLQLIQRMFNRSPEARLSRLKFRREATEQDIRELQRELDYYDRRIEKLEREFESVDSRRSQQQS